MIKVLSIISMILFSSYVYAGGHIENNLHVQIIIGKGCEVTQGPLINVGNIDFGEYPNLKKVIDGKSTTTTGSVIGLNCTKGLTFHISLNDGSQPDGKQRRMKGETGDYIKYDLYKDAAHTHHWDSELSEAESGTGKDTPLIIYGRIPRQSEVKAGTYTDTVTVTVSW
ncbi:MAG: spore coat U domain-containing protein [Candidatus Dasytiphilus stammeri]